MQSATKNGIVARLDSESEHSSQERSKRKRIDDNGLRRPAIEISALTFFVFSPVCSRVRALQLSVLSFVI